MSQFFSEKFRTLEAYVPGEQPQDRSYVKLNTNESPYSPSPAVREAAAREAQQLQLYSDPEVKPLRAALARVYDVKPENICCGNGSDELLNFIFLAYGDRDHGFIFPDLTYGFYPVFCRLNAVPYEEKPLRPDFTVDLSDYLHDPRHVVIANPNAPTGIALGLADIETLAASDPDRLVVIDEAYVDFGAESAVALTKKYPNLLVVSTFSKSRSLAGGRLGFVIADAALIRDLETIRYSTNPYNVNRMSMAAGVAALSEQEYYTANCQKVARTREDAAAKLEALGFTVLPSKSNFLFARPPRISGGELYLSLKARGVLVRHFSKPRIADWVRITVGSPEQMDILLRETEAILRENV
ncbi:MAG: histidinol-phosphate transaminase [Oscillospiraceae bacterium]|nr:histidinol-phosphate transaminase [Oscillospiraceae bacterium]